MPQLRMLKKTRSFRFKKGVMLQFPYLIPFPLSISTSVITMFTQSHEPISHSHLFSSSSFTTFIQRPNPLPYPPLTLVKHPLWFLDNTDLFLSHNEILFGLHQDMFQSPYFSTILQTIEPGQTTAQGTIPTFPISCNNISQTTLLAFILL